MSGSDPVHRADMALLIARLLVSATNDESPVNVKNAADGTFTVVGVAAKDWDYFADSRRSQNRVSDSAASALYELGVAKGTGMGYFSPAASVSRDEMAAFITRALAHTSARPAGVSIQSDEAGGVIVSVRDANFHPVANAAVDVFSADADKVGEAFNADGTCNKPRVDGVGGNATVWRDRRSRCHNRPQRRLRPRRGHREREGRRHHRVGLDRRCRRQGRRRRRRTRPRHPHRGDPNAGR